MMTTHIDNLPSHIKGDITKLRKYKIRCLSRRLLNYYRRLFTEKKLDSFALVNPLIVLALKLALQL